MVYKTCLRGWVVLALGLLFLAACAPTAETKTVVPVTRPATSTPTLETVANQPAPLTSTASEPATTISEATSTATPILTGDVRATDEAEAATFYAPIFTSTPSPTFTPLPGQAWPIFFKGVPCQDTFRCEDTLFMNQRSAGYLINSDGSQLTSIADLGFPADFSRPVFSADGTQLAYLANFEPEGVWHLFLVNADGSEAVDLGAGAFFDYQFIAEADCLIGVRFVSRAIEGMDFSVEKRCIGQTQPQELEAITFPVFYEIHFSPQGDALLAYGEDSLGEVQLLVHPIGGSTQVIFSQPSEYFTGSARWLPDGETIEFISTGHLDPNDTITTTFNLIEQDGNNLEAQLSVAAAFTVSDGNWSPDGQQFAFTYGYNSEPPEESGLYILDLNTGEWRQILSHFFLGSPGQIDVWKQDIDRALE